MVYIDDDIAHRLALLTRDYAADDCVPLSPQASAEWQALVTAGYLQKYDAGIDSQGRRIVTYRTTPFGKLALQLRNLARAEAA